jgi:TonB family protein
LTSRRDAVVSIAEKRHAPRTIPEHLVYLDIKPENGGIVLNISEEGLSFQCVAPVQVGQQLTVCFFERSETMHLSGEVAWTDQPRKLGGLRFTQVSEAGRATLGELLRPAPDGEPPAQLSLELGPDDEFDAPDARLDELPAEYASAYTYASGGVDLTAPDTPASVEIDERTISSDKSLVRCQEDMRRKTVVSWLATITLLTCALIASMALIHRSGKSVENPSSPSPLQPAQTAMTATAIASAAPADAISTANVTESGVLFRHTKTTIRHKAVRTSPAPDADRRVLITAAPVRFGYPVVSDPNLSGKVALRLWISPNGAVQGATVLTGERALAMASARAARRWRYQPAIMNGVPVPAQADVTITFAGEDAVSVAFRQ